MRRERYLALSAEHALHSGRPLHEELSLALAAAGKARKRETAAVEHAREGRLHDSLLALETQPLVAAAALVRPESVDAVGRRLLALPTPLAIMLRPWTLLFYFGSVVLIQVVIVALVQRTIFPVLMHEIAQSGGRVPAQAAFFDAAARLVPVLAVLVLILAALFSSRVVPFAPRIFPRFLPLWSLAAARACAAASAVCAAGARPEEALPPLLRCVRIAPERLAALLAPGALDTAGLDELSRHFVAEAEERAFRVAEGIKIVGTILIALCTAGIVGAVFLRLPSTWSAP